MTTCVGLRYGSSSNCKTSFSWKLLEVIICVAEALQYYQSHKDLQRTIPSVRKLLLTPSLVYSLDEYRNINLSAIRLRFRLALRCRLTLIRLTLIRNPSVYRCAGFPPALSLLMPTFAFLSSPLWLAAFSFTDLRMLPYHYY